MKRSCLPFFLSALCLFLSPVLVFSQNGGASSNQNQPFFPQLQGSPLNNSSLQSAPMAMGSQSIQSKTQNPVQHSQKTAPQAPAFPKINTGAGIIGQGASVFPASAAGSHGVHLRPMPLSSSASGGSGINSFSHIGNATAYSAAPTYAYPSPAKPAHPAANLRPSSLVTPNTAAPAQKITPVYVAPNPNGAGSGGIGGNPNMTPQACVATGVCK